MLLAIDPGYGRCGYAVFDEHGVLIHYDLIETTSKESFEQRLLAIYNKLSKCVIEYQITQIVYEEPAFISGRNALLIPQVIGAINLICAINNIKPIKYSPSHIKLVVAGNGSASKTAVEDAVVIEFMLSRVDFKQKFGGGNDDVYDAIAVGYCKFIDRYIDTPVKLNKRKKK
jgi:crossover junction endodeoxyribonuclease RuvC